MKFVKVDRYILYCFAFSVFDVITKGVLLNRVQLIIIIGNGPQVHQAQGKMTSNALCFAHFHGLSVTILFAFKRHILQLAE